jgi:hypothetical protein
MVDIDKKRVAAVRTLEALGYSYNNGAWSPPACPSPARQLDEADAMHGMLIRRADALAGCTEGSAKEIELKAIVDAIDAYEAQRWPLGKAPSVPRGKG